MRASTSQPRAAVLLALSTCTVLASCTDAASSDPGLSAILQIDDAQYRPGPLPSDEGGPMGSELRPRYAALTIGQIRSTARAVFDPQTRVAAIGIDGVDGAWLVPAGAPDIDTEGHPIARFTFGLRDGSEPGPFTLVAMGAGDDGRFGAAVSTEIVAAEEPPPTGELVIGLTWSGPADLDLHVVDSLGGEAWSDKPNTMIPPPPGTPIDPSSTEHLLHGQLDHDGNRACTQHARPSEHVIWQMPPQPGEYTVRVDTRSMCGAPSAVWYVDVYRPSADGTELLGSARGTSTPADTQLGIDKLGLGRAGLGVTALRFTL